MSRSDEARVKGNPESKRSLEVNLGRNDLPQSSVICEKRVSPQDVIINKDRGKTLKPDAVPSTTGDETTELADLPVRRSNRQRVLKKRGMSLETKSPKKKSPRQLFKATSTVKYTKKAKQTEISKNEDENSDPNQDLLVRQPRAKQRKHESRKTTKSLEKVKLKGDDERGHAIAEWYLVDVFEATRMITSVLRQGTLVTDNLVANMEETIIEMISKLLQRLSSVLITSLEEEFGIKCNIMNILKNLHENIKDKVSQLVAEENGNGETSVEQEDLYEKALKRLNPDEETPNVIEEVVSTPFDEDCFMEHSYSRPSEEETEKRTKVKGKLLKTDPKLQCGFCAFKTYWKSRLRRHMEHHLFSKRRYDCNVCEYSATTSEAYRRHIRTHTGEKPFSCTICSFRTANKSNLNRHYVTHTDLKPFACPYCDHTTRQKSSIDLHVATHLKNIDEQSKGLKNIYACGDCNFITISRAEFIRHGKTHKKYNCGHCDYVGKDYQELKVHQSTHNGLEHSCQMCHRKCKSADELRLHLETHDKKEELVCDLCNYRTLIPSYLKRHIACHSGQKPYKCDVCFNTFRLQSHLAIHARKHEIGPYCKKSSM